MGLPRAFGPRARSGTERTNEEDIMVDWVRVWNRRIEDVEVPEEETARTDAREIWRRFRENQVEAEGCFNSTFFVDGTIDHVDRDERGRIRVHFKIDAWHTLRVLFPEAARDNVRRLRPGDQVSCCACIGEVDSGYVVLQAVDYPS